MQKVKKLVILGDSAFAEVAYECFTHDSQYEVVGFSVETAHLTKTELFGLPIVPFERLEEYFSPGDVDFYAALVYSQLNSCAHDSFWLRRPKGLGPPAISVVALLFGITSNWGSTALFLRTTQSSLSLR